MSAGSLDDLDGKRRLTVFTNIPNPYNHHLYGALRRIGWDLRVVYKGDPASAGRSWRIEPDKRDVITGSLRDEYRELRRSRAEERDVILTGGYAGVIEAERRALTVRSPGQLLFWGERLSADRRVNAALRRLFFAGLDGVLAVGTWAVDSYRAVVRSAPVHVFPYTTAASGPPERSLAPTPVIGFVGDLIERKGVDILVEALAGIPEGQRPALEVVGDGPAREGLVQRARRLGLAVEWLGHVGADELQGHQRRWWAQAVPSRYDGWGMVVAEALAAGVPVLASSRVGAAVDLVRDGLNGAVVRPGQDWAPVVQRYTDIEVVTREGRRARIVAQAFSADAAAGWLTSLLLDGAGTAPPRSFVADAWQSLQGTLDDG